MTPLRQRMSDDLAAFLRQQRSKEWVIHVKPPFGSPEQVLKYLARSTHRVIISDHRILRIEGDAVIFRHRDRTGGNCQRTMRLDGVEFLRRFLLHVFPTGLVRIRYYGLLANCVSADNLARCRELLASRSPPVAGSRSTSRPEPTHDDRYRCPSCGAGRLLHIRTLDPAPVPGLDGLPSLRPDRHDTS